MANEINLNVSLTVKNGAFSDQFKPGSLNITQNAIGRGGYVQAIGTSEEVISFGDVNTAGLLVLYNLSTTDYVDWGPESSGAMVAVGRLLPSDAPAVARVKPGTVLRAQANGNSCLVDVRLYEA